MDYKKTLLIPKTNFEMQANLLKKESNIQKIWKDKDIYNKLLKLNKKNKHFILHDGPPYANGDLHLGHGLNKILKDIIIRHNNSLGNYSPFICGWDTHGLPIENAVAKNFKMNNNLSDVDKRNLFKKYALEQVSKQTNQFEKLGLFTDFSIKYLTLNLDYEIEQLKLFNLMYKKNLIFRDMKPVYWSPSSKTALAEAEIEYKDMESSAIYVDFSVINGNKKIPKNTKIIIWTTTPWTIPANILLAVGEKIEYSLFEFNKNKYVVATELIEIFCKKNNFNNIEIINKCLGSEMVNLETKHPLYERNSKIVLGHHVTASSGTGIVHIAPGFGEDDYIIGKNNNVNIFVPINDYGKFTSEVNDKDIEGIFYEKANNILIDKLKNNQKLLSVENYKHQYPIDWRTKKPVIFRATKQWFVLIDKIKKELINELEKVEWKKSWSKIKMMNMIKDREEWCISRQRLWGVPIIAFYDEKNNLQISNELISHVISILEKNGIDVWYDWKCDDLLPKKYQNKGWTKEKDIMDVWFDSGISILYFHSKFNLDIPVDVYLEGSDQFRGWFNSSLINSVVKFGKRPYKTLLSHGFVMDEKGHKMSKSSGNGLTLLKACNIYGADLLRLWASSVDYNDDVRFGNLIMKQISDSYRKIRNTIRFILGNLNDFNFKKHKKNKLEEVDKFILYKSSTYKDKINDYFKNYNFNLFFLETMNFVSKDLSSFYFDFIKDILYIEKENSKRRRQIQTTLYYILEILLDVLKPVLVHTAEEAYLHFNKNNKKESVFLEKYKKRNIKIENDLIIKWNDVIKFKNDINKALEVARNQKLITKSLEAKITVKLKKEFIHLEKIDNLSQILIIGELNFVKTDSVISNEFETSFISIEPKIGEKCARCWTIVNELVNKEICNNCYKNIN